MEIVHKVGSYTLTKSSLKALTVKPSVNNIIVNSFDELVDVQDKGGIILNVLLDNFARTGVVFVNYSTIGDSISNCLLPMNIPRGYSLKVATPIKRCKYNLPDYTGGVYIAHNNHTTKIN